MTWTRTGAQEMKDGSYAIRKEMLDGCTMYILTIENDAPRYFDSFEDAAGAAEDHRFKEKGND
jgi:hypothetical protein